MTINQQAARMRLLLDLGMIKPSEIIAWADDEIAKADKPVYALIEISTCPINFTDSMSNYLDSISSEISIWSAIISASPVILQIIEKEPLRAAKVARFFYKIAVSFGYEVPSGFSFFTSADDDFDLAEGGCFSFDDVYKDFVKNLKSLQELKLQ